MYIYIYIYLYIYIYPESNQSEFYINVNLTPLTLYSLDILRVKTLNYTKHDAIGGVHVLRVTMKNYFSSKLKILN